MSPPPDKGWSPSWNHPEAGDLCGWQANHHHHHLPGRGWRQQATHFEHQWHVPQQQAGHHHHQDHPCVGHHDPVWSHRSVPTIMHVIVSIHSDLTVF